MSVLTCASPCVLGVVCVVWARRVYAPTKPLPPSDIPLPPTELYGAAHCNAKLLYIYCPINSCFLISMV